MGMPEVQRRRNWPLGSTIVFSEENAKIRSAQVRPGVDDGRQQGVQIQLSRQDIAQMVQQLDLRVGRFFARKGTGPLSFGAAHFIDIMLHFILAGAGAQGRLHHGEQGHGTQRALEQRDVSERQSGFKPAPHIGMQRAAGGEDDERKVGPGGLLPNPIGQGRKVDCVERFVGNDGCSGAFAQLFAKIFYVRNKPRPQDGPAGARNGPDRRRGRQELG